MVHRNEDKPESNNQLNNSESNFVKLYWKWNTRRKQKERKAGERQVLKRVSSQLLSAYQQYSFSFM